MMPEKLSNVIKIVLIDSNIEDSKIIKKFIERQSNFSLLAHFHTMEDAIIKSGNLQPKVVAIAFKDAGDVDSLMDKVRQSFPKECSFIALVEDMGDAELTYQKFMLAGAHYIGEKYPLEEKKFIEIVQCFGDIIERHIDDSWLSR